MKTMSRIITLIIIAFMLFNMAGCYGSFSLTKKVYNWNGSLGDKWINSAVMWVLMFIPVYSAAGFVDVVILNTVEFWTGQNPLAMNQGEQSIKYATNDGKTYKIVTTRNNISITETSGPDKGKAITLNYTPETGTWTMNDGKESTIIAAMKNNQLKLIYPDGAAKNIPLVR